MNQGPITNNDDPEILVRVENLSKKFCRDLKRSLWYGLKDLGNELMGRPHGGDGELRKDEFWAVKDVSFELKRGDCLGLIGRNGAGKTTLLRMLNGLIKPDKGQIEMRGRVGALIALGAGFNPILTGRENIYVNAAVLGLSKKETNAKLEEIVEFAELGDFIDAPVQSYSSGMYVRLGFSIAAHLNPDILLVDEALAVGDLPFIVRCLNRIAELRENGTAIIFVSHNEVQIRETARNCMLLDRGQGTWHNCIDDAFIAYSALHQNIEREFQSKFLGYVYDGPVKIIGFNILGNDACNSIRTGEDVKIVLRCKATERVNDLCFELRFWDSKEQLVSTLNSQTCNMKYDLPKGKSSFHIHIKNLPLSPSRYRLAGGFRREGSVLGWSWDIAYLNVEKPKGCWISNGLVMMKSHIQFIGESNE